MLQRGGIVAIIEFWNWTNDGPVCSGVGLHGDFNMTGSYHEMGNLMYWADRHWFDR